MKRKKLRPDFYFAFVEAQEIADIVDVLSDLVSCHRGAYGAGEDCVAVQQAEKWIGMYHDSHKAKR